VKNGTFASPAIARASKQGLARAGRADHEHALRDLAAEALELRRVLQEVDDLDDFFLRFLDAGHVGERDADLVLAEQTRPTLAERHGAAAATGSLHLAHEIHPDADQKQDGEGRDEELQQEIRLFRRRAGERHAASLEIADQSRVARFGVVNDERIAARASAVNGLAFNDDVLDGAVPYPRQKGGVLGSGNALVAHAEVADDGPQDNRDYDPKDDVFCQIVQSVTS
jgi:hypothetical protein